MTCLMISLLKTDTQNKNSAGVNRCTSGTGVGVLLQVPLRRWSTVPKAQLNNTSLCFKYTFRKAHDCDAVVLK